ncbi:MAG: copper chaperone PCu(A)C [Pseudomonadota bacterium]
MPYRRIGCVCAVLLGAQLGAMSQGKAESRSLAIDTFEVVMNLAPGRPAAGYGVITGPSGAALRAVSSPEVGRIEMHIIERDGTIAKMVRVDSLQIQPAGDLIFKRGSNHLMLFNIENDAANDGIIPLTFSFSDGQTLSFDAKIN